MSCYHVFQDSSSAAHPSTGMSRLLSCKVQPGSLRKLRSRVASFSDQRVLLCRSMDQPITEHQLLQEKELRTKLHCETGLIPCSTESFTADSGISLCRNILIQPVWVRDLCPQQIRSNIAQPDPVLSGVASISPSALLRFSDPLNYRKYIFKSCLLSVCKQKRYFPKLKKNPKQSVILGEFPD